jgi:hypothetical protein
VGLLKNPNLEKMAIENKGVATAFFNETGLIQQPHCY